MAKDVTDASQGIYGAGIGYGIKDSDAEWTTRHVLFSYGASICSEDGTTVVLDSPEAKAAIELLVGIAEDGSTPPSSVNWDDTGNNKAYLAGQVASTFNSATLYLSALSNPDLADVTKLAPIPSGPAGNNIVAACMGYGIFDGAENPEWAELLIEYLLEKNWYNEWILSCAPLFAPVYQDLANESEWTDNETNKMVIESVMNCGFLGYPGPNTPEAGIIYNKRYINQMMQEILINGMSVDDALAYFQNLILEEVY